MVSQKDFGPGGIRTDKRGQNRATRMVNQTGFGLCGIKTEISLKPKVTRPVS
jgi:hypothetical protein